MAAQGFGGLAGHQYVRLTTFRKSGAAVRTPIWFAEDGGRLYFLTEPEAGKVKRIRNSGRVLVAPCTAGGKELGPDVAGSARLLGGAEAQAADALLSKKYGFQKKAFDLLNRLRGRSYAFVEIAPGQ